MRRHGRPIRCGDVVAPPDRRPAVCYPSCPLRACSDCIRRSDLPENLHRVTIDASVVLRGLSCELRIAPGAQS